MPCLLSVYIVCCNPVSKLKPNSKPWYTKKCYESRKKFHKARKLYNRFKNEINKNQLLDCSKQYKQTTNKAYNGYQLQLENKLRNTSKYNGKDFWKILNRFAKNKKDVMGEFKISSISGERLSILISISILLLSLSIFVFRFLK
jgi:hypothetical protein